MHLWNDRPSFTPLNSRIRANGPRKLHLAKGRGPNPGIEALILVQAEATVSLHLDSPETALWSACVNKKMPLLLSERYPLADFDRLLALRLPSDVICLDASVSPKPYLRNRYVDVVVVASGVSMTRILKIWQLAGSQSKLIMINPDPDVANALTEYLDLSCIEITGQDHVFGLPDKL